MSKIKVAILGATGTVGQKLIKMLETHPKFEVAELVASERSTGELYGEIVHWREFGEVPEAVKKLKIISYKEVTAPYALSSIPGELASEIEGGLAAKGVHIISNTSAHRMFPDIPLVIPEINKSHFVLTNKQKTKGKIITNPNCSTVFLALGLNPLHKNFTIEDVSVFTLQAISGAGYPGVASLDILGNTIPNIGGEEKKIEQEILKILGAAEVHANFPVFANVNRVPVDHGHSITMHVRVKEKTSLEALRELFQAETKKFPGAYKYYTEDFKPQPKFSLTWDDNKTHIGRIRLSPCGHKISVISMGHNLVRGAAGAAILNLEAFHEFLNS